MLSSATESDQKVGSMNHRESIIETGFYKKAFAVFK